MAIGFSLGVMGYAGYVSSFRNSHVLNGSQQDIRLDQADRNQQERKYGQQSISELQSAAGNGPVFGNLIAALFGVTASYIIGFSGLILLGKRRWIYGSSVCWPLFSLVSLVRSDCFLASIFTASG